VLAKNCRTSVEMIERYYAAHLKDVVDVSAINVRKQRAPKKDVAVIRREELATYVSASSRLIVRDFEHAIGSFVLRVTSSSGC